MHEVQKNTNTEDYFLNVLVCCFKQKKQVFKRTLVLNKLTPLTELEMRE